MALQHSPRKQAATVPAHETNGHSPLVARLGFMTVAEHIDELRLFYLIGCAYHDGAKSLRRIAAMLSNPPAEWIVRNPRVRVDANLAKSLRAIHKAVVVLEDLVGEHLVNRSGEGFGYNRLTAAGERLWEQMVTFLHDVWG